MAEGMRALMATAVDDPLPFTVTMYCGQMVISGRIAPDSWWYEVTERGMREEAWQGFRKIRKDDERRAQFENAVRPFSEKLYEARSHDQGDSDEVTLVDVAIFPAVGTQGTQSGGQKLPIAGAPAFDRYLVDRGWRNDPRSRRRRMGIPVSDRQLDAEKRSARKGA